MPMITIQRVQILLKDRKEKEYDQGSNSQNRKQRRSHIR